jgi:peptidoglycan/LPS O-acetylase OafA/YrhL
MAAGRLPLPVCFSSPHKARQSDGRSPEVDWIKAIGILTVVLIHALPNIYTGDQISLVDEWIGQVTHFAVPGFLVCSGFLFAGSSSSRSWASVRPRLQRILLPYLVFSAVSWCYCLAWDLLGRPASAGDPTPFWQKVVLFSTMGHYYYVFLITFLVLVTPLIARIPRALIPGATLVAMALQLAAEIQLIPLPPLFWHIRSPLRCLGPFLLGWQASLGLEALGRLGASGRGRHVWLAIFFVLMVGCWVGVEVVDIFGQLRLFIGWVGIYTTLGFLLMVTLGQRDAPTCVRWLSDASYPIYLSHVFFMTPLLACWPYVSGTFDPLRIFAAWAVSLASSVVFVMLCRRILGAKLARKWIG